VLSDIEDGDESDNSDDESLRPRNSITTDESSFSSRSSSATESRDDSVVGPLNDGAPYNSESGQTDDTQQPAAPPASLDSHSAVSNSGRTPLTIYRPRSRIHVPSRFRRYTNRFRREPVAPSPSVVTADAIKRVPRMVMVKHAFSLNFILVARARDPPRHGGSLRHPSPVIEPREPDGVVLQHCVDLHHALLPLEGWERDGVAEECRAAEERDVERDLEMELLSIFSPDALFEISDADEVALLQPDQSGVDGSNEDGEVARCGEEKSLRDLMREFSCYTFMRNVGAGLKNKVRKWRR